RPRSPLLLPFPQRSAQEHQDGERALREARSVRAEHRDRLQALQEQQEQLRQQEQRLHQANPSFPSPGRPRREPEPFPTAPFPPFSRCGQERLSLARQRERLQQLRDELSPGGPGTLLGTVPANGPCSALAAPVAPSVQGLLPRLLPPVGMFLGDSGGPLASAALYGHLLLLKHRAQMDHDFLENERVFLESLKKRP
ncbi:FBF1 factor, partial [Aleadryas rufinucha]|nr:FBF1 factor [Aleadryas rufinucha]